MNAEEFQTILDGFGIVGPVAVAVSGGPDSMALAYALVHWTSLEVHVLCVDHGLRSDAAGEAAMVAAQAEKWGARFQALKWDHDGVSERVQEEARRARYELMAEYCSEHEIKHLFLGHHMDDQAETVLFRLAKGSGLDGLCGMKRQQAYDENLMLLRPFLGVPKAELVMLCEAHDVPYVSDPSNEDEAYARVRLRAARRALEAEGLSAKRLAVTARRLERARDALDSIAEGVYERSLLEIKSNRIVFNYKIFEEQPEEIVLRCLLRAMDVLRFKADYAPRMEKVEALLEDLRSPEAFRKRTLGGLIFSRKDETHEIIIQVE